VFGAPANDTIIVLGFLGLAAWAAYSDALYFRIPNSVSVGIDWPGAVLIAVILFSAGVLLFSQGIVGGGDVKFLAATALWAGPTHIFPFLIVMGFAGGALALAIWLLRIGRRIRSVPDAPAEIPAVILVPYGIAIAAGAAYLGIHLWLAGN